MATDRPDLRLVVHFIPIITIHQYETDVIIAMYCMGGGVGKMRNCGMRKVKCGTDRAEKYRGIVCNLRNAENHYHSQN